MKFIFIIIMALLLSSVQGSRRQRRARRANAAANRRATAMIVKLKCAGIEKYFPEETCPSCPTANYKEYTENAGVVDYWKQHCAPLYKKSEEKTGLMQLFGNALFFFVAFGTAYTMFTNTSR